MEFATYFDIIVGVIIIILSFKGLFTGFIREICLTIGIIGGVWLASRYNGIFGDFVKSTFSIDSVTLVNLIAFMIILALMWIIALIVSEVFIKFIKVLRIGVFDKILGVLFAGIKIFLILSIIFFTFSKINFLSNFTGKLADSSFLYGTMIKVGNVIVKTDFASKIKKNVSENVSDGLKEIQDSI